MMEYTTAKDLIAELQKVSGDRIIVMAHDGEGNSYSPLFSIWDGSYDPETGDVGLEKLTKADKKQGFTQRDIVEGLPAIILVPC